MPISTCGSVGRTYTVFSRFNDFLKHRNNFEHCHELIIDHANNQPNIAGRLVFDFDIKYDKNITIPSNFKKQVERTIISSINKFYDDVDIDRLQFVWSTCKNKTKLSKHLTVKNLYFEDWIFMTKQFYQLFSLMWNKKYDWICSNKLIDLQIVRKNASLRMVGSNKIGGNILKFDDLEFILTDSLIRIYSKQDKKAEQLVTMDQLNKSAKCINNNKSVVIKPTTKYIGLNAVVEDPVYDMAVYNKAFEMLNIIRKGAFKMGKINGNRIDILRVNKCKCILSDTVHDNENAFLIVIKSELYYQVRFGCYRYCNEDYKTFHIGDISVDDTQIVYVDYEFL